jgi:hypothetical protein
MTNDLVHGLLEVGDEALPDRNRLWLIAIRSPHRVPRSTPRPVVPAGSAAPLCCRDNPTSRNPIRLGDAACCCARAASGQATAAPPSSVRNSRRLISNMARFPPPASAGVPSPRLLAGYRRDFKPELFPQKHGQEDQDRVQRDPHDVGRPTPPLLYGLLAHGEFSLA